jgi:copper chaperone CopZ
VPKSHRHGRSLAKVKDSLKKVPGVKDVEVNERTGSILVHHDEGANTLESIGAALQEVASELFDVLLEVEEDEIPGLSSIGKLVKSQVEKADTKIARATDNWVDLKMVVPIGFLVAGITKAIQDGALLAEIPPFVLLYYAYDTFTKFHGPSVNPVSGATRVDSADGKLENPVKEELKKRRSPVT